MSSRRPVAPRPSSTPARPEPKVTGIAFRTIDTCFTELCGPEARERAHAAFPQELADAYRYSTLLAASWYPVAWYCGAFAAYRRVTGSGADLPRRIGKLAARHDMSGVHKRLVARILSPQALLGISQMVFNTYYDTGTFEVLRSTKGFVQVRISGCLGWDQSMWQEVAGSCESLLEIAGAKAPAVTFLSGGGDRDTTSMLEGTWV